MSRYVLGIMVSTDRLHAVLVERTEEDDTVVPLRTSMTRAGGDGGDLPFGEAEGMTPGMEEESDDVTIQFGDEGNGSDDMFMGSEFDDLAGDEGGVGAPSESEPAWNFQAELDDLLDRCAEHGYEDPEIAFCSTTSEIDRVELRLPTDESDEEEATEDERGLPLPTDRSTLLEMLEEQYEGSIEDGRVGFVPMHRTGDGRQRVLALIARPGGPVLSTLESMQEQTLARSPRAQVLDTEISLYLGLVRSVLQLPPDTPEKTILVRSGPEDTLVLFVEGNTLRQAEHLPELTAEDSAETICSRVLLLQDEYGMGEVQHLMLIAEENEGELADAFRSYFANADLRLLRTHLPDGEETEAGAYVAATGAALRRLEAPDYEPFFQPVNLLAKRYAASTFRLPVGWSVPVLLGLLAVTTLGFVWYYFANASAISERRARLRTLEQQVQQVDPQALQRRIDSVQSVAAQYADANTVVESLLYGSNKWSKGLATLSGQVNRLEGLSVRKWSPETATEVTVAGRANERAKVVRLAQRLNGDILDLTFTETRDVSMYNFQLTIPLDTTKPEAVQYWREQQGERLAAVDRRTQVQTPTTDTAASGETAPAATPEKGRSAMTASASDGEETASATPGWTVVVASLAQRSAAETVARRFRTRLEDAEHPVQIHRYAARDRYRVGIGHFGSTDSAATVLREMNGVLPEDAWLLRVSGDGPSDSSTTAAARQSAPSAPDSTNSRAALTEP